MGIASFFYSYRVRCSCAIGWGIVAPTSAHDGGAGLDNATRNATRKAL